MTDIRAVLASNIRERRKKLNLSQDELATRINSATGYIGMIERARQFPSPLMLEKIARALEVDTLELFSIPLTPEDSVKQLHEKILNDLQNAVGVALENAVKNTISRNLCELKPGRTKENNCPQTGMPIP